MADYANVTSSGKLNVMGIFNEINPPTLPFVLPQMYLVTTYSAGPGEFETKKNTRILLSDEDGSELLAISQELNVPKSRKPGARAFINQMVGLARVKFNNPGDYQISILVENDLKITVPVTVNPPPSEPEKKS